MINGISTYYDAGFKAGQAMNRKDMASFNHHNGWKNRAVNLESQTNERGMSDRALAENSYSEGYSASRTNIFRNV